MIVDYQKRDEKRIQLITSRIKDLANPRSIILFGSVAQGTSSEDSDIDILVVDDSPKDKKLLAFEISKALFPRNFGLDLFVQSPEELSKNSQQSFWNSILETGTVLYERA